MNKINDINEIANKFKIFEQYMEGYKDGKYILQVFVASKYSWFYVIVYDENDILIGVFTVLMDKTITLDRIKYAANYKLIRKLADRFIKQKEKEYVSED